MENLENLKSTAFKFGCIFGIILFSADIATFYSLASSRSVGLLLTAYFVSSIILPLGIAIILTKRLRKSVGGYWNLRQATSGIFIVFITAFIISSICSYVFIQYVNPQTLLEARDNLIAVLSGLLDNMGAEPDQIDKLEEEITASFESMTQFSLSAAFSNLLKMIIILFITALIFAAIFKREQPVSTNHEYQ